MNSLPKLKDQGYKIFKEVLFKPLFDTATSAIIEEIEKQRKGEHAIDD